MIGDPLFDPTRSRSGSPNRIRHIAGLCGQNAASWSDCSPRPTTFLADLARAVTIPCQLDVISVNRYGEGDGIAMEKDLAIPIEDRHVILVDDTVDTGLTLQFVVKTLLARNPASLAVCTLLDRPHRRIADIEIKYRGFEAPDVFVVGYGLGYLGRYRELPALYAHGTWPA